MADETSSIRQQFAGFNLYDIFANFLPGAILIGGVYLPFFSKDVGLPEISIIEAIILIIISFVIGSILQAIASLLIRQSHDPPFAEHLKSLRGNNSYEKLDNSELDSQFVSACRAKFKVDIKDDEFDDWGHLFKAVISDLENSSWTRSLRIQALHLSARGISVTFLILCFYYLSFPICGFDAANDVVFDDSTAVYVLSSTFFILSIISYLRSNHFERDVVQYLMSEFYLKNRDVIEED